MNREGVGLLRALIDRSATLTPFVQSGDCKLIAVEINGWMPSDLQVSAADVYAAIKDRRDFGGPKMNVELLRARIDAMPVLTSARLSGGIGAWQAILNELSLDPELVGITIEDVKAAMELRVVPKPSRVAQGAAALVGTARIG